MSTDFALLTLVGKMRKNHFMKVNKIIFLLLLISFISCDKDKIKSINPMETVEDAIDADHGTASGLTISEEYMKLVNDHRADLGFARLILDKKISGIIKEHVEAMMKGDVSFGHTGFSSRCSQIRDIMGGGNLCGEIVAMGQSDAQKVFNSWMNSSGHRAKIEEGRYTHTGFAYGKSSKGTMYWAQIFKELN